MDWNVTMISCGHLILQFCKVSLWNTHDSKSLHKYHIIISSRTSNGKKYIMDLKANQNVNLKLINYKYDEKRQL